MEEKIKLPKLEEDIRPYKFLIIEYNKEYYLRWSPLRVDGIYVEHSEIEQAFINELMEANLPRTLGNIYGGRARIYPNKTIEIDSMGSFTYKDADFNLVKELIESEHSDYNVIHELHCKL